MNKNLYKAIGTLLQAPGVANAVQARPHLFVVPTTGRPARLCRIEIGFQQSERRWIKTLRLHLRLRCNASFDEFVRHEETQGLIRPQSGTPAWAR
jgi:hypothetical protein